MWTSPENLILVVPAFLLSICFHEAAHAWMAFQFGDTTARDLGRLSLNPLVHLDVMGTIVFFVAGFGWAKPVPVDMGRLRNPLRDGLWIAAAGPGANILLAIPSALLLRLLVATGGLGLGALSGSVVSFLYMMLTINLVLAVFNMIPLHPLDGSKVLMGLLPEEWLGPYLRFCTVGPAVLFGLIIMGRMSGHSILGAFLWPTVQFLGGLLTGGLV